MNDSVPTLAELLEQIRRSRTVLDTRIAGLDSATLGAAPPGGGWSVKDHLAHIAAWERGTIGLLAGNSRREVMGVSREAWDDGDEDRVNAELHAASQDLSADEVLRTYHDTHAELVGVLEGMTDADLVRPYRAFQPDSDQELPVANWIAGNTFGHYDEHGPWIDEVLASLEEPEA